MNAYTIAALVLVASYVPALVFAIALCAVASNADDLAGRDDR